jgi:hypothetical protein
MVRFDAQRLSRLDWAVLGAGLIALIALFLPWYGVTVAGFSASVSGFSTGYGWLGGLLMVGAAVWFFCWRSDVALPKEPLTPLVVTTGAAGLGLLLVAIRWATMPRGGGGVLGRSFNYGPRAGIWIALIAGIVEVACAGLLFRKSGESLPWKS